MIDRDLPTPETSALAAQAPRKRRWSERIPVVSHLRQSVGLQRGMLVVGLVITGVFVLTAILAPVIAPYSWAQQAVNGG